MVRRFRVSTLAAEQALALGGSLFPTTAVAAALVGLVFLLQSHREFRKYGVDREAIPVGYQVIAKEVGPVFAGFLFAGRCGTGIAAEVGAMTLGEEVRAMRLLGLSPARLLVVPRLVASGLIGLLATGLFYAASTLSAFLYAVHGLRLVTPSRFLGLVDFASADILRGLVKGAVFGLVAAAAACAVGLLADARAPEGRGSPASWAGWRRPRDVREAATAAFGLAAVLILACDLAIEGGVRF